jgi:hypothetical protein
MASTVHSHTKAQASRNPNCFDYLIACLSDAIFLSFDSLKHNVSYKPLRKSNQRVATSTATSAFQPLATSQGLILRLKLPRHSESANVYVVIRRHRDSPCRYYSGLPLFRRPRRWLPPPLLMELAARKRGHGTTTRTTTRTYRCRRRTTTQQRQPPASPPSPPGPRPKRPKRRAPAASRSTCTVPEPFRPVVSFRFTPSDTPAGATSSWTQRWNFRDSVFLSDIQGERLPDRPLDSKRVWPPLGYSLSPDLDIVLVRMCFFSACGNGPTARYAPPMTCRLVDCWCRDLLDVLDPPPFPELIGGNAQLQFERPYVVRSKLTR